MLRFRVIGNQKGAPRSEVRCMRKKVDFAYVSTASRSTLSEYLHSDAFRVMCHTPLCAGATSRNGSKAHQRTYNEVHMQCTYYVFSDQLQLQRERNARQVPGHLSAISRELGTVSSLRFS